MYNLEIIKQRAQEYLTKSRYEHTLRVCNAALNIVEKKKSNSTLLNDFPIEKLKVAILLHDIAKQFNPDTIQKLGIQSKDTQKEVFLKYPKIWHAFIGPLVVENVFQITDSQISDAIRNHTTGQPNMSDLSKLVFIADYVEPERKIPISDWIIELSVKNLDYAIYVISVLTINFLNKNNTKIHQNTLECYSYYKDKLEMKIKSSLDKKIKNYNL